jgi:pyruvate dehydrogenase E2 component (dihydrolipoamide acetyltransferase)
MPTPVVMPQMGESIAEGTVVRWIKKVGDRVDRDEPLFEISTDKVDAEIPSPAAGVLLDIRVHEGETVAIDSVVATIGESSEATAVADVDDASPPAAADSTKDQPRASRPSRKDTAAPKTASTVGQASSPASSAGETAVSDGRKVRTSPLVRRIARDHSIDLAQVAGTGLNGRVTKHDILGFIDARPEGSPSAGAADQPVVFSPAESTHVQPLSIIRRKIAEHMILSRRTSAHVHTVFHVNFSHVDKLRQQHKARYEAQGAKLTYMAFVVRAAAGALSRFPLINASLDGTNIVYKRDINIGIAVALDTGLIVPVIKGAAQQKLADVSRAIVDLAERARTKQLKAEEVQGGTFTITNPGGVGAQFGMPIINQPQVAILGVGTIEKRPIVIDDAIAIRTMGYLTLGFDHRLIDGVVADGFMADIKQGIEQFDPAEV